MVKINLGDSPPVSHPYLDRILCLHFPLCQYKVNPLSLPLELP